MSDSQPDSLAENSLLELPTVLPHALPLHAWALLVAFSRRTKSLTFVRLQDHSPPIWRMTLRQPATTDSIRHQGVDASKRLFPPHTDWNRPRPTCSTRRLTPRRFIHR